MNIAVFCSSSNHIANQYLKEGFRLGEKMAETGHTLVYGGATGGLMDAVAEGARSKNGNIIGVIPQAVINMNRLSTLPTQLIRVDTMSERKARMKEIADLFVVLPGSYGTLDEMFDIIASAIVGEHKKKLYIINQDDFYNLLIRQIDLMREQLFIPFDEKYKPCVCTSVDDCINRIESGNKKS